MSMRIVVVLVSFCGLPACGSATAPSEPVDRQVVVAAGQTTSVGEAGVSIRFEGVQGDSRCPIDASCIQGGDALVRLGVEAHGRRATVELHTGDPRVTARHENVTIALVDLHPYPFSRTAIPPDDYRVTLRVTR